MRRYLCGALTAGLLLILARPASALIVRLISLKELVGYSTCIASCKVEKVEGQRPAVFLTVERDLKGKLPTRRLPINLTGDSEAQKARQTPELLKRLAAGVPLIAFIHQDGTTYTCFFYTNGTWFQVQGKKDGDGIRWAFLHAEPYLRRTFKGTTEELADLLPDMIAGKKEGPKPDPREKPGWGPELPTKKQSSLHRTGGPVFAVIPTAALGAPLAFLAFFFPAAFAAVMLVLRRWAALLTCVSINGTLVAVHKWFENDIASRWWGTPGVLWTVQVLITILCAGWAWRRHLRTLNSDSAAVEPPSRGERWTVGVLTVLIAAGVAALAWWGTPTHSDPFWRLCLVICAGFCAGLLDVIWVSLTSERRQGTPYLPPEGVGLGAMILAGVLLTTSSVVTGPALQNSMQSNSQTSGRVGAEFVRHPTTDGEVWVFNRDGGYKVSSTPTLAGEHVLVTLIKGDPNPFKQGANAGLVVCLERASGKVVWTFDNSAGPGVKLRQIHSSPLVVEGKVLFGEGLHEDRQCRLFCVDAATGKYLWHADTESHVESTPCAAAGKVYVGAGDDGLYCVDLASGKKLWQYPRPGGEGLHIDSNPCVLGDRVYCCSGASQTYKNFQVFCLNAQTGEKVWATPLTEDDVRLPAWGSPLVAEGKVFVGLGNGRLNISDDQPKGRLLCLDAKSGRRLWVNKDMTDAVHTRPVLDRRRVYVASRDGQVYCIRSDNGRTLWKYNLGAPSTSSPAMAYCSESGLATSLFVAGSQGLIACLDPATGDEDWKWDALTRHPTQLLSGLQLESAKVEGGYRRRLYFACEVGGNTAVVFCLEDRWNSGRK